MGKFARVALLAVAVPAAVFASGSAPSRDIVGLSIGGPLTLEECSTTQLAGITTYEMSYSVDSKPCYQNRQMVGRGLGGLDPEGHLVHFVLGDTPYQIKSDFALGIVVSGKLEGVTLYTRGLDVQATVLEMLTEKYGKPSEVSTEKWQNRMGASFDGVVAKWRFTDLDVSFTGLGSSLDSGYISVETPAGTQGMARVEAQRKARQPKL